VWYASEYLERRVNADGHTRARQHGGRGYSLAGLVSQPPAFRQVLAAAEDVPYQSIPAEQAVVGLHWCAVCSRGRGPVQGRLDQGPAPANPVAIAPVDQLVGAAGEAALWCVLASRQPGQESRDIKIPAGFRQRSARGRVVVRAVALEGGVGIHDDLSDQLTSECFCGGNRGWRGIPTRKRRMHHGPRRPA